MLKIMFVMYSNAMPVPAKKGGAIETLMTMLLKQNEKYGYFKFIFVSPDSVDGIQEWRYSKCYTCSTKINNFPEEMPHPENAEETKLLEAYPYDYKASLIAKYEKADYIIMEGCASRISNYFEKVSSKKRRAIHLHSCSERVGIYKEAFGITIAPSDFSAREWNKGDTENIRRTYVLRNAIEVEKFVGPVNEKECLEIRKKLGLREEDFVVLFVGRLIPEKGVKELISAVLGIADKNVKLLLIGSDSFANGNQTPYAKEIQRMSDENSERIIYLGYIPNADLPIYYRSADMQAVPSMWEEAVGLVALEGMCSKLPLLLTNSGGMTEFVPNGAGLVICRDENIIEKMSEGILWMKNNPEIRTAMAQQAFTEVQKYSSENYYISFCKMMQWWKEKTDQE